MKLQALFIKQTQNLRVFLKMKILSVFQEDFAKKLPNFLHDRVS